MPVNYQLPKRIVLPKAVVPEPLFKPIGKIILKQNEVNKMKYIDFNEFKKLQLQQNVKKFRTQSDNDDDCVLVEEQNMVRTQGLNFLWTDKLKEKNNSKIKAEQQ